MSNNTVHGPLTDSGRASVELAVDGCLTRARRELISAMRLLDRAGNREGHAEAAQAILHIEDALDTLEARA